jgi:hypothetical protein
MIPLTEFLFPMYKPVLKLMGLAEVPKSDSIIRLIPLSVIPLSGAHCIYIGLKNPKGLIKNPQNFTF